MNYLTKIIEKLQKLLDKIVYHKRYKAFQKWLTTQNLQSYAQYQQDLFAQYFFRGKRDLFLSISAQTMESPLAILIF